MSIWSKTGSSAWTQINSLFVKTGSVTWTEMLSAWVKTGSNTWTKIFTKLLVPANTVLPDVTGSTYLYGTLTGSLGSWTSPNGTNSYARQWQRASNSGGVAGSFSNISGATSSTYTTTASDDNKFILLKVTATNLSGSTTAQSYEYLITKYAPVPLSTYSLSGSSIVGGTLTALEQIGTWKATTAITGDTSPDTVEYEWSWSDGTIRQSTAFNSINSYTYTIVAGDLGKTIRVRVTGKNSGGSDTTGYTSSGAVTSVYSFNFGNTLYVGSNGYIGLDNGGSTAASPGSGRNINIYSSDLVQYKLQEYSDSSNYYLYFRSYNYQSPLVRAAANAVDYQIKFYTGQPYCDIYIVRRGASVPTQSNGPGYYSSGFTGYAGIPGPYVWSAGSVLRSYFNGTIGSQSALTWTAISDSVWKDISNSDLDDSYTSVLTSPNQQAAILTAPTITSVSATKENKPVSAYFTGGSGPYYQIYWTTGVAPTIAVNADGEGTSSPVTDTTGPASTGSTYYMYVRSVYAAGHTGIGPTSLASAWSSGYSFTVASGNLIAPTISSVTAGPQGGAVSVYFSGGDGPFYQAYWTGNTPPTTAVTPDASGSSSPLTDSTGPSSTGTVYMYVRSVATQSDTAVGPSTTASAWSSGVAFNMTSTAVSQSTAPSATATSNGSTTTVKYGDSITWSGGTYTNQASKTSVLIYSTNTSNLVSPGGDTNSATRTSSPYTLSTTDPTGTPYVFAVRDTVVGTNGTTYYFYSNQITSALADAVAFSYGASTSAAGGWTASVNSGTQTGATYSYVSATAGSGSVVASTGAVTASGLSSAQSSTITVSKSVSGYNNASTTVSGTANTVVASYTITYNGNGNTGGSTTATTGNGSVTLRANGFTRTNASFAGWATSSTGAVAYSGGAPYTLSADATLYAVWTANTVTFTNPTVTFTGTTGSGASTQRSWSWTTGSVSGATANGYEWSISSTSATTGFGAFTATTSTTLTVTASTARWLKVRKVGIDGLGAKVVSGTNNGV